MKALLYWVIDVISHVHEDILHLNDAMEASFTDKELHFLVIGVLGMAIFFAVHAVFKRLAKLSVTAVSFIYVFTVMVVITFAIEIGQKVSGTGNMDFSDIVSGMWGFMAMFAVYASARLLLLLGRSLHRRLRAKPKDGN